MSNLRSPGWRGRGPIPACCRRIRRRGGAGRAESGATEHVEAPSETSAASAIPAVSQRPEHALSAHLIGQAGPAETAGVGLGPIIFPFSSRCPLDQF